MLLQEIYPIEGALRTPLMLMEWYFAFACFELGSFFILRYLKGAEKHMRLLQELGFASLLLGFSVMWFLYIFSDYYSSTAILQPFLIWPSGSERMFFLALGYLAMILGALFCTLLMEKYMVYFFKRYFFTVIFLIMLAGFTVIFFIDMRIVQGISFVFWPAFLAFFIVYFYKFIKKSRTTQQNKAAILRFFWGFILMAFGFSLSTDALIGLFGLGIRIAGTSFQLLAVGLLSYFFVKMPPFIEYDWEEKIKSIHLIHNSGMGMYYHDFREKRSVTEAHLISGAISTVNHILGEMTDTKKGEISVIDKEKEKLLIYPRKYVTGVIFCDDALNSIKTRLREFTAKIEFIYEGILENWDGDMEISTSFNNIAKEFFPVEEKDMGSA